MTEHEREIIERLKRIEAYIIGNGDSSKGLIVRVDRLEQTVGSWRKWLTAAACGLATAIGGSLWALLRK